MKRLNLSKETLTRLDAETSGAVNAGQIVSKGGPCLTVDYRTQCACQILTYQIGCSGTAWAQ